MTPAAFRASCDERRREEPIEPAAVAHEALSEIPRHLVADTCERRAALELKGAAAFTIITQALVDLRADTRIVDLSAQAIAQELEHSRIYLALAREYRGADVASPQMEPIDAPDFAQAPQALRPLLQVVAMCAVNETMACGFLELSLRGTRAPVVRRALRRVLADEIHHARIGWALLGSSRVGPPERHAIGPWLVPILEGHLVGWRSQIATLPEGAFPDHGCPSGDAIERAALATIRDVVLPGFASAGIDVAAAWRWLEAAP
jgi:hypothetical protein